MFGQAIVTAAMGILLHQTDPVIEAFHTDSETLRLMSRYGVGVLGNMPTFNMFMKFLGLDKRTRTLVLMAYLISFIFIGIGVFLGRVFRSIPAR